MKTLIKLACQASLIAVVSADQEFDLLATTTDEIFETQQDEQQLQTTTTDETLEQSEKLLAKELRITEQEQEKLTRLQSSYENRKNLTKTQANRGQQQKLERFESQVDGGRRLSVDSASSFGSSASSGRRLGRSSKSSDSNNQGEIAPELTADTLLFASAPEFEGTDVTSFYQFWEYLGQLFGFGGSEEVTVSTEEPVTLQDIVDQDLVVEEETPNVNRRLRQNDSSIKTQEAKKTYSKKDSPEATNLQANQNSRFYRVEEDQPEVQEQEQEDIVAIEEPVTLQDIVDQDPVVEEENPNVNRRLNQGKRQNDQSLKVKPVKENGGDSDDDSDSEDEEATTTTEPAIVVEEPIVSIEEPVDTVVVDTTSNNVN